MCLFINDEQAILEPHNDILATALVVIGFVIFAAVMSNAYLTYDEQSHSIENYEEASRIAESIASWDELQGTRPDILSADTLEDISYPVSDIDKHDLFFARFSTNNEFSAEVRTDDGKHHWSIHKSQTEASGNVIAASIPVIIEINPAQYTSGTLTVRLWKRYI
ncbi:hypothetical protein ACT9XH_06075 [Methanococcoides methylutens]|uniref:hypothetical protein n=1 Tax=Methanococcoides methylutens TaxID=2226 RepID=UPI00404508C3